jgi:hypothetical protein
MFELDFATWLGADLSVFGLYVRINAYLYFILASWLTIGSGYKYLRKYGWVFVPGKGSPEIHS